MDEASASESTPAGASGASEAITSATEKRPAVKRRRPRASRRRRLATQGVVTLFAALMIVGVAASLIESGWQTFNPINGIGVVGALPLRPQSFGDTATFTPDASTPAIDSPVAISGQTHKPTASPTATNVPGGSGGVASVAGSYPSSFTGSWSGGAGQDCPSGGAPKPRTNVIYNASSYGRPRTNMVALTFDDGPTPFTSPPIISFLEQTHTPATFFVMGQYARAYPWLVQREAADGFAIGVHTWNHPDMQLLSVSARAYQLGATIQQLHDDLGPNFCAWLWRPPYGSVNSGIVEQADAFGLTTINWDVDPQDWSRPGTMVIVQRVLAQVRPGSIILMHDGPAARQQTAAALPYILAGLQARGLVPVTIPTLLGSASAPTGPVVTPTPIPSPTAIATATDTPSPTATATDTPTPTATATDTPTTGSTSIGGPLAATSSGAIPIALSRWLWQNTIAGYSGA
ncbi:MAG TPA: polysaccharide deacetylase family protein [Ktedonobacterales bacterium]